MTNQEATTKLFNYCCATASKGVFVETINDCQSILISKFMSLVSITIKPYPKQSKYGVMIKEDNGKSYVIDRMEGHILKDLLRLYNYAKDDRLIALAIQLEINQ